VTEGAVTVGRLARRFGLSRSTLLYYDRIGLLRPAARSGANYRRYDGADAARLEQICRYRTAGVPLADIARLLASRGDEAAVLERRLAELNREIARLRAQQEVIVRILRRPALRRRLRGLDRDGWVALLRAAGLDAESMRTWHREFERTAPGAHQDFLESLGIPAADVRRIRAWARRGGGPRLSAAAAPGRRRRDPG
jgi:DNA-binding transcriptional MerR regulator